MFRAMYQDVQSERLLLVALETPESYAREYRHIRATVVRRAVPHKMKDYSGAVDVWNDDYTEKCSGYRNASYVLTKTSGTYVDDMQLRGQIDVCDKPLHEGRPYGNDIKFKPFEVCQNAARAINDFYTKFDKFVDKHGIARRPDDFYVALNHLAQFLKITTVLFYKPQVRHCSLAETNCFSEVDIAFAEQVILNMLAPFYKPNAQE